MRRQPASVDFKLLSVVGGMEVADVKNKEFILRGTASDALSDKPEKNQKKLGKALAKMFKKFPPTPGQK